MATSFNIDKCKVLYLVEIIPNRNAKLDQSQDIVPGNAYVSS